MPDVYDLSSPQRLLVGMREARAALGLGDVIVMPTDTVYGIAANAFNAEAVTKLLEAKGRDRTSPPPVLVADNATIDALASEVPDEIRELVARYWPGPLTVILPAQPSLQWDLGETHGTVALRIPDNEYARELPR
jgi:tRNA threonylcarbamoyl adenosine modification protein (Sua5/YciO/YrdC/YwlC family)